MYKKNIYVQDNDYNGTCKDLPYYVISIGTKHSLATLFNHNNKKAEPFPAQQTSWFSSSSNTYSSVYHLCLQLDEYEIIIHYSFQW